MPQKRKEKKDSLENTERHSAADDQKERGYYYDDAHGYEVYCADDDADDCEQEKGTTKNDRAES